MTITSATTWLASYPKSGNTWVRAQLDALESGQQPDFNSLNKSGTHDRMDSSLGVPLGDLSDAETASMLRLSWAVYRPSHGAVIRRKTHRSWSVAADGFPIPWQPPHAKVIYIVRDPRAVVASWAHHLGVGMEEAVEVMGMTKVENGLPDAHGEQDLVSWSEHVTSWLDDCTLPLLMVRYEDMLLEPERELARMADFMDMSTTAEDIANATQACEFSSLAAREIFEGFSEAARPGASFFRRGEAEAWKWEVDAETIDRVCLDHGPVMKLLGYLT